MRVLIPCGGRGSRMRSVAGDLPKEMLSVGGAPAIDWVLRECVDSGARQILLVTAPGKELLAEHVRALHARGAMAAALHIVTQDAPKGLADAVRLGREFASGEPLAVALPDNAFIAPHPALAQVAQTHDRTGHNVVAVVTITADQAGRRGPTAALEGQRSGDEFYPASIPDKGARDATFDHANAPAAFTAVGRYVFNPEMFELINYVERQLPPGAELDDVPVMQQLLARRHLVGRVIMGEFLDLGLPSGYAEANEVLSRHQRPFTDRSSAAHTE